MILVNPKVNLGGDKIYDLLKYLPDLTYQNYYNKESGSRIPIYIIIIFVNIERENS